MGGSERRRFARCVVASVACSTLAWAPCANAQQRDPAAAEVLFKEGRALANAGNHDAACAKFRESHSLDPAPGTAFFLADCEEKRGNLATAWALFEEVSQRLSPEDKRRAAVAERAAALEPRLPRLTIRLAPSAPAETEIRRDGVAVGRASVGVAVPVDPGKHSISATAPGRASKSFAVELAERQSKEVTVEPGALEPTATPARPRETPPPPSNLRRTLGFVVGGVGVAGFVGAAVTGGVLLSRDAEIEDQCPDKRCSSDGAETIRGSESLIAVNYVLWGVGIAGVGAGLVLVLTAPSETAAETALLPSMGPGGGALSLRRRF